MKKLLIRFFEYLDIFYPRSFSLEGEDIILKTIFNNTKGSYVDIGAYHPKRYSNTYFFYKKGWRGINIDPRPNFKLMFKLFRPFDINLNIAIGNSGYFNYYMFAEPAYNTFDVNTFKSISKRQKLKDINLITKYPLSHILDNYKLKDLLLFNIDVEGLSLEVLKSNNWDKYRPKVIIVEKDGNDIEGYLSSLNYTLYAMINKTLIFIAK